MKKVLVIGGGGREHALAWALARSPHVQTVYVAPGNAGTNWRANSSPKGLQPRAEITSVPISASDIRALMDYARLQKMALTVVGPEDPLAAGIVDAFQEAQLPIFGPTRAAAQLESSKIFAKTFMREHRIPCADGAAFTSYETAQQFLLDRGGQQHRQCSLVVKADGLAAGKGVVVCDTIAEAQRALRRMMVEREFGAAGERVILEERLHGREISVLALCDGHRAVQLVPARDHKPVFDGDRGPNTGGMGAYTHPPDVSTETLELIQQTIIRPTMEGMAARGTPYVGVLYAGLMLTDQGVKVLEFNCRFGDPETQAILPLLDCDLFAILMACVERRLDPSMLKFRPGVGATVVLASAGYPGPYPKGLPIRGLEVVEQHDDHVFVFHAGTARQQGSIVTAGGRVLSISATGSTHAEAIHRVYEAIRHIHFDGMHYRRDIGRNIAS